MGEKASNTQSHQRHEQEARVEKEKARCQATRHALFAHTDGKGHLCRGGSRKALTQRQQLDKDARGEPTVAFNKKLCEG